MNISKESAVANYELFYKKAAESRNLLTKAINADESALNTKRHVLSLYNKALRELQYALNINIDRCPADKREYIHTTRATLQKHLELTQGRASDLMNELRINNGDPLGRSLPTAKNNVPIKKAYSAPATASSPSTSKPTILLNRQTLANGVNAKMAEEILPTIIDTSDIRLDDILGNEKAKQALEESVIYPTLNPDLFSGLRQPCKGILLFGPPGNGKTMLAKAVATESKCTFFNISAATIMSKWVGEGERLMQALFQMARNAQPSIIFIDEVDSMLSERTENENGASRRVKTEFLLQFDGCSTKSDDRVLVLAATNRPQELDDGVLRRFPRRIYIDLPDERARAALIKHNFHRTNTRVNFSERELITIAKQSEGYSFSDLSALCREAAMFPLKGLSRERLQSAKAHDLRPVSFSDLVEATKLVRASCNQENIKKLKEFAFQFA